MTSGIEGIDRSAAQISDVIDSVVTALAQVDSLITVAETGLAYALEHVSATGRVVDLGKLGDTLGERRHVYLNFSPWTTQRPPRW